MRDASESSALASRMRDSGNAAKLMEVVG